MAWTFAAKRTDLHDREVLGVACQGRRVALYRLGDEVFATSDTCPHLGAALSEGCIVAGFVECPAHFALFDIRTGAADGGVTTRAVRTFATKVEHEDIYIDLPEETAS
jgi:nitrite reductase/ring-hydroxylating ferredoxin subunit